MKLIRLQNLRTSKCLARSRRVNPIERELLRAPEETALLQSPDAGVH